MSNSRKSPEKKKQNNIEKKKRKSMEKIQNHREESRKTYGKV